MDYKQIVGLMGGCNVKEVVRELNWEYLKMQTKKKDFFLKAGDFIFYIWKMRSSFLMIIVQSVIISDAR